MLYYFLLHVFERKNCGGIRVCLSAVCLKNTVYTMVFWPQNGLYPPPSGYGKIPPNWHNQVRWDYLHSVYTEDLWNFQHKMTNQQHFSQKSSHQSWLLSQGTSPEEAKAQEICTALVWRWRSISCYRGGGLRHCNPSVARQGSATACWSTAFSRALSSHCRLTLFRADSTLADKTTWGLCPNLSTPVKTTT